MQPKMCTKCKKNIAVVFITRIENGATLNEGYCLKCARSLGIPQIDTAVQQMGFSDEDLDNLTDEMSSMFGQMDSGDDGEETDSQTATFPLLNQLFGAGNLPAKKEQPGSDGQEKESAEKGKKKSRILKLTYFQALYYNKYEAARKNTIEAKTNEIVFKIRFTSTHPFPSYRLCRKPR